eukprot:Awhi_evm12s12155
MSTLKPLKRRDIINTQHILLNPNLPNQQGDVIYTPTQPFSNVTVNLPYQIQIPTSGSTTIRLQKCFFNQAEMTPSTSHFMYVYIKNLPLMSQINNINFDGSSLIATVPVLNTGQQYYLESVDSSIEQQLFDNNDIGYLDIDIRNEKGEVLSFTADNAPIMQFIIETSFDDQSDGGGQLLVSQIYS